MRPTVAGHYNSTQILAHALDIGSTKTHRFSKTFKIKVHGDYLRDIRNIQDFDLMYEQSCFDKNRMTLSALTFVRIISCL